MKGCLEGLVLVDKGGGRIDCNCFFREEQFKKTSWRLDSLGRCYL